MNLRQRFWQFNQQHQLITPVDKVLVAVSGGKDSMLLLTLLVQSAIPVEIAHCNFQLRGSESDGDQALVEAYAKTRHIPCHVRHFDTRQYAETHKISIQMAARALRYKWFDELSITLGCTKIAIAQHLNDTVETVLLNLARGTGLPGLQGIQPVRGNIIRPLLCLNAKEVNQLVQSLQIPYRDDSSNFSNKYARNKIRLEIIPRFEELNSDFLQNMQANMERFQESHLLLQNLLKPIRELFFQEENQDSWRIAKRDFERHDIPMLFALFEPYGFTKPVLEDAKRSAAGETGRLFKSATHLLLLDRDYWLLRRIGAIQTPVQLFSPATALQFGKYNFDIHVSADLTIKHSTKQVKLDMEKLIFPLTVRVWQEGDTFQPLGMQGKKKLSDFFIQQKINLFEKKDVPIWVNGNGDIIWISGMRLDNRYKITENTQKVLTLVLR